MGIFVRRIGILTFSKVSLLDGLLIELIKVAEIFFGKHVKIDMAEPWKKEIREDIPICTPGMEEKQAFTHLMGHHIWMPRL